MHADTHDMRAIAGEDKQAFARVVQRHQQRILAYCISVLGSATEAQDIAQDVFLTLWRERSAYKEQQKLEFYLLKIARFRCLAHLKKRKAGWRIQSKARELQEHSPAPCPPVGPDPRLALALANLPAKHRDILILRHLEELSLEQIQSLTGLRMGTIKSRLHRGMAALREELEHVE